jgi:hypothetical protein
MMGKLLSMVVGLIFLILLFPLIVTGLGEFVMSLPVVGTCIATLAAVVLRKRS